MIYKNYILKCPFYWGFEGQFKKKSTVFYSQTWRCYFSMDFEGLKIFFKAKTFF